MPHKSKFLLPILIFLVVLPMIATDIYLPVIPSVGSQLGAMGVDMIYTLTAYMLGYSISLLIAGILADIYGRRFISIIGISIFFIASIGCFFASTVQELIAMRFFQALGGGCGTLIARIIVRDVYDQQSQVRILSYLAAGMVFSPIFAPIIGAYISSYFGWRSIFIILASLSLLVLMLMCAFMKESLVIHGHKHSFRFRLVLAQYLDLCRHREFVFYTLAISFAWSIYFTFLSSSPVLIQDKYQITPINYSYIFSATISGFIFGTIFIRWKISVIDLRQLISVAGAIILISTLMMYILATLEIQLLQVQLLFAFFALFGIGIIFPVAQAGVTRPFKNNIGLISGLFYSTEMFFGAICGYILSCIGITTWSVTTLAMLIIAACIVILSAIDKWHGKNNQIVMFETSTK